jgi:hypothetical protein
MLKKNIELNPQCINGTIAFAVTNRGHLIPCCRCDDPPTMNDPEFQKLLAVSKISDYNSIEEILTTEEWINFEKNLKNHKGPPACFYICKKDKNEKDIQTTKMIDTETKKIVFKDRR